MRQLSANKMSESDKAIMRRWSQEHRKAVRQLTVQQKNTKHATGTLPLNMYQKDLPIGERIPGPAVSETAQRNANINSVNVETAEQESEYDSASDEEDARGDAEPLREVEINDVDINFLSKTIRTHSGRAITLSNRALSSYS